MTPRALPSTAARDLTAREDRWLRASAERLRDRAVQRRVARPARPTRDEESSR